MNMILSKADKKIYYFKKRPEEQTGENYEKTYEQEVNSGSLAVVTENSATLLERFETRQLPPVQLKRPRSESEEVYYNTNDHNNETCPVVNHRRETSSEVENQGPKGINLAIAQGEHNEGIEVKYSLEGKGSPGQKLLNFYGVVKDDTNKAVEGAVVMLFGCLAGGGEKVLEHTFTDREGAYFISMPAQPDDHIITGFKVRAGKAGIINENKNHREHKPEERQVHFYPGDLYRFFKIFYPGI